MKILPIDFLSLQWFSTVKWKCYGRPIIDYGRFVLFCLGLSAINDLPYCNVLQNTVTIFLHQLKMIIKKNKHNNISPKKRKNKTLEWNFGFSSCMPVITKIMRVIHAMIEMNNSQYKTKFNIQNNALLKILINAKIQN